MDAKFAIGNSDFRDLREKARSFVDKSRFIGEVIRDDSQTIVLPRPRRFGKTTNLLMLRYFLAQSHEDLSRLFCDLEIWQDAEARTHFQQYPVIYLTLKDAKGKTWETCEAKIRREMSGMVLSFSWLIEAASTPARVKRDLQKVIDLEGDAALYSTILRTVSEQLERACGRKVVVLIDEYDTPLQHGWMNNYFDDAVEFFQGFLGAGLKDNTAIFKGVITGVLRISKENFFSDLNNITVYSLLHPRYKDCFGFTEPELIQILDRMREQELLEPLRQMYNGYLFGGKHPIEIYNPWSIIRCLSHPDREMTAYWLNTSANLLLQELLMNSGSNMTADIEALFQGKMLERWVTEHLVMRDVHTDPQTLWSFLLFCGYLRGTLVESEPDEYLLQLELPNREVRSIYERTFRKWLLSRFGSEQSWSQFLEALLIADAGAVEAGLNRALEHISFLDAAGGQPEKFYHGLSLGLLVALQGQYRVVSNREAMYGRADLQLQPLTPGRPGVVLELKTPAPEQSLKSAMQDALTQLRTREYKRELERCGATPVHALGLVFWGKRVWVRDESALDDPAQMKALDGKKAKAVAAPTFVSRLTARRKASRHEADTAPYSKSPAAVLGEAARSATVLRPMERAILAQHLAEVIPVEELQRLMSNLGLLLPVHTEGKPLEYVWSHALREAEAAGVETVAALIQLGRMRYPQLHAFTELPELCAKLGLA